MLRRALARGPHRSPVTSNSMAPLAREGDIFVIVPAGKRGPVFGDVVAAVAGSRAVVHRVVGKRLGFYVTKGDASPGFDPRVRRQDLLGRVRALQKSGGGTISLDGARGRLVGAVLASLSLAEGIAGDVVSPPAILRRFFYLAARLVCLALPAR